MPRATNKKELLILGNEKFEKLIEIINSMTEEQQNTKFNFNEDSSKKEAHWKRDKNIRDVLIHLYEWHQLLLKWVESNLSENEESFIPKPYNWKTYGDMNIKLWEKHQNTEYSKSKEMLKDSHSKVIKLIESFSDEEVFTKNYFNWTGGSTLGQYCTSVTSSHYDWAIKKIKAHIKDLSK